MSQSQELIPVYYQGQPWHGDPDHYVTWEEMRRGLAAHDYSPINRATALLKLTTCLPKYPEHLDSQKGGWQGVSLNTHSFKFRRDYGALQRRLGPKVMQLTIAVNTRKHGKSHCPQRVSYSPTQARDTNAKDPGTLVRARVVPTGQPADDAAQSHG
jgi:hypothetical protein